MRPEQDDKGVVVRTSIEIGDCVICLVYPDSREFDGVVEQANGTWLRVREDDGRLTWALRALARRIEPGAR